MFLSSCTQTEKLKTGDFLFQNLDNTKLSESIEKATSNKEDFQISHMGIVTIENNTVFVIEAFDSVQKTPIVSFLKRSTYENGMPKVIVGRLKSGFQKHIKAAIKRANKLLGKPYDKEFRLNNGKYYCSELVYESFLDNENKPIFLVKPMSFVNIETGKIDQTWLDYYKKLNCKIPQGELGNNPADYAKSDAIQIIDIKF